MKYRHDPLEKFIFIDDKIYSMSKNKSMKTVLTFSFASFLNDLGAGIIYPVWPLFVTTVLHANMAALGLLDGIGDSLQYVSQALSGYFSDKLRKRKVFIWIGYLLGGLSRIGYALSGSWQWLIPFKITDRLGKLRDAPRDAIIADVSKTETRGRNFGILKALDKLGKFSGVVAAMLLMGLGYKKMFILAAIPSFIAAALVFLLIKDRTGGKIHKPIKLKNASKSYVIFVILSAIFSLGMFSYSFMLIKARDMGVDSHLIPLLYLIFTLTMTLVSIPSGKLADKLGRKTMIVASYVLWILTLFGFVYVKSIAGIFFLFVLYGLFKGAYDPVVVTFVSELSPPESRASAIGFYRMVVGLCALPSSVIAGSLWTLFGAEYPFYLSIFLTVVAISMLPFVKK